jgi:signal transduction histidine kinase
MDPKGLGIGLYVVEKMVKLLGGSVACVSEEGKGTRFTALVPEGKAALPAPESPQDGA